MRCVIYLNVCDVGFEKWSGGPGASEIVRNYLKKCWCRTRNIYLLWQLNLNGGSSTLRRRSAPFRRLEKSCNWTAIFGPSEILLIHCSGSVWVLSGDQTMPLEMRLEDFRKTFISKSSGDGTILRSPQRRSLDGHRPIISHCSSTV